MRSSGCPRASRRLRLLASRSRRARVTHSRRGSRHHAAARVVDKAGALEDPAPRPWRCPVAFARSASRRWTPARVVLGGGSAQPHVPLRRQHLPGGGGPAPKPTQVSGRRIRFRRSPGITRPRGLPYNGRLVHGTQLPVRGPDWVTWDPIPTATEYAETPLRKRAHDPRDPLGDPRFRAKYPHAPRVVIATSATAAARWTITHPTKTGLTSTSTFRDATVSSARRRRAARSTTGSRGAPRPVPRGRCADDLRWLFDPPPRAGRVVVRGRAMSTT